MGALLDELLNVEQDGCDVELLLLFLLALEGTLGLVYVFLPYHSPLFALMPIPPADVLDGLDGGELAVGDVDVMGDPHEGLVDVGDGVDHLSCLLVGLPNHVVETLDFWVVEDDGHNLECHQGRHIFDGVVVFIHADIGQEVDELQEVVPFGSPVLEVLRDRAEVLLVEGNLHPLRLDLAVRILGELRLVLFGLHLEPITENILLVFKEMLQDDVLVLLQNAVLASDEG